MRNRWRGDDEHRLPAQKIEPYRLWFEFLKLASTDPDVQINTVFYCRWAQVIDVDFDDWWSSHWRDLFAVDIGVRICELGDEREKHSDADLILRVPLYRDKRRTLREISDILDEHGANERLADMKQGQFHLSLGTSETGRSIHPSTRFLRNLSKVRLLLNIYRFWLSNMELGQRKRLEQTARSYSNWADQWNKKVRTGKWNRPLIELPHAISEYVDFLNKRGTRKRVPLYELSEADVANQRRQIKRYIRKARQIALNVGCGEFPGVY